MDEIKAITTYYNGFKFRSRLEARWAVFFSELGLKFEYEPEGFELENGDKYLPDFFLPESETYVEVKALDAVKLTITDDGVVFEDGREKSSKYAKFAEGITNRCNFLFLVGDPMNVFGRNHGVSGEGKLFFKSACIFRGQDQETDHGKCAECEFEEICCYDITAFVNGKPFIVDGIDNMKFMPLYKTITLMVMTENEPIYVECEKQEVEDWLKNTLRAALTARQARFEFGEKG